MSEKKINLPAIKRGGVLKKIGGKKSIKGLNLKKENAVSNILKSDSSVQKGILQSEKGLDLVLAGDLTGSMQSYHALLKDKFSELSAQLFPMIKKLRIGIVFYLDHGSGDPYVTRVQKLTTNVQELVQFINATPTGHGGDSDEAVEDALYDLSVNMNWKEINDRSVVIFGDASPHPVNNCPRGHDFFNLTKDLYSKGTTINSVFCSHYNQQELQCLVNVNIGDFSRQVSYLSPPDFFSWIANVTGGMVISIKNVDDLVDIIAASAAKDSGHLDDYEEQLKLKNPKKLKLVELARKSDNKRKISSQKSLNYKEEKK